MNPIHFENMKLNINEAFQLAIELLSKERFWDVVNICQQITAIQPDHYRAHHGIGLGLHRTGKTTEGIAQIKMAIAINPEYFSAYNNLGNILRETGDLEEALEAYLKAETLQPTTPVIQHNIGSVLKDMNRTEEALLRFRAAIELDPNYFDALLGTALCLHKIGEIEEAKSAYQHLLRLKPDHPDALYSLATLMKEIDQPKIAYELYCKAIEVMPEMYDAHLAKANLLSEQVNMGMDWAQEEALDSYRKASDLKPEDHSTHITIGNLLLARGETDDALDEFRRAILLKPHSNIARSCLLMGLQYHPGPTLAELYKESLLWQVNCSSEISRKSDHLNSRDPNRRIKIGYVSADLRMHPVGFYLLPALYHHSTDKFEVYCYSNSKETDIFTERLRSYADKWRDIVDLNDNELHDLIVNDGIDILVDLSGHTGGNRLLVFASKPAPVQVSWIGFFFTTGIKEIDYILMDATAVPDGEECYFTEKVIRLPETRFCYEPPKTAPEIVSPPALKNGYITFGSFNNLAKVTPDVIKAWAQIMRSTPNSRIILKSHVLGNNHVKIRIAGQFAAEGISQERLDLRGVSPHIKMLAEYGDMDIALDPFPFNGGLTSCEALWMGVPVLTVFGNRPIARQSAGFLKTIGLEGFIAKDVQDCCNLAIKWSNNISELTLIRDGLRQKMNSSLLCNGKLFTENLEKAYRDMWREWCLH